MKTLRSIVLIWGVALVLIGAGAIAYPPLNGPVSDILLQVSGSLLGVVSYLVYKGERGNRAKLVFLNFALFFGVNAMIGPMYQLAKRGCFLSDVWSDFYFFQYHWLQYFLLLSLSILWVVVDHIVSSRSTCSKYCVFVAIVVAVWVAIFYPFLLDPKYVYKEPDVRNFVMVRAAIDSLKINGNSNPSPSAITLSARIDPGIDTLSKSETSEKVRELYVLELQKYIPGQNYLLLLFKPLFVRCSLISLLAVICILFYIIYQYLVDTPRGAYMEKIVWSLLLYCVLEALHMFVYTRITSLDRYVNIADLGGYLSTMTMYLLLLLFGLRLRFIQTVEGDYYERRLTSDPSRITRWRDALDNWLLKQFMNPGDLDRRFLAQRRTEE